MDCRSEGDKKLSNINVKAEVKVEKQKNDKNLGSQHQRQGLNRFRADIRNSIWQQRLCRIENGSTVDDFSRCTV